MTLHPSRSIFFTLNGTFLGKAFEKVKGGDLYPTIGVDTKSGIEVNFGEREWKYDVKNLWEEGRGGVEQNLEGRRRANTY